MTIPTRTNGTSPEREPGATRSLRLLHVVAWATFPLAGTAWIATRYGKYWYHHDEWQIIPRTLNLETLTHSMLVGSNGHFAPVLYVTYGLQRSLFGLEGNALTWTVFCISVGALQVTIAAVLHRLCVPTLPALAVATVVTFLGAGAQNVAYQVQWSANLALAICLGAGAIALGEARQRSAILISAMLVSAFLIDSVLAIIGAAFVAVLVAFLWPRRLIAISLIPLGVAFAAWSSFGDKGQGTTLVAPLGKQLNWIYHLTTLAAGALLGGGATDGPLARSIGASHARDHPAIPVSGEILGLVLIAATAISAYLAARNGLITRRIVAGMVAAGLTAVLIGLTTARSRAWLLPVSSIPGSRYLHWTAIFLTIAIAPVIAALVRPVAQRAQVLSGVVTMVALTAVFIAGLQQLYPVRSFEETWGMSVKRDVQQAVTVLSEGCANGLRPRGSTEVAGEGSFVTVGLVRRLMADRSLTADWGTRPSVDMEIRMCGLQPAPGDGPISYPPTA